ncbi:hypothetical protein PF008_g365 [Phytophthora fragariae]|uniref:Uncharacterized protein n=1 Tax=Phytophthora fragariae TaxID=53985 RepID=A0A6G0SN56_9STRA|nr:hypothetical protein PF008_g365 [Phytophthora fragariae]
MGTLIDQLLLCVRTEAVRSRPFTTKIQPRPDMLRRVREMTKAKLIREVTPMKISIDFLTGTGPQAAATSTLHVVSDQLERVYDAQDRRTKEALPVIACNSTQKARMETAGMPGTGWEVDITAQKCSYRKFLKVGCCTSSTVSQ